MEFSIIAELFENLSSTTKRLEKVLILRKFILKNKKESPIILDLISGNFQREIDKKTLGISLKTVLSSISLASNTSELLLEKEFNKKGDVGIVAQNNLLKNKQSSLNESKKLTLNDIILSFSQISQKSGTNKNKSKKEILSKLFLSANSQNEYKYLARLLIDDLRIGVSEGVLREAVVNSYFPKIIGLHIICEKCGYASLNMEKCFKCSSKLDLKNQEEIASKKYKIVEVGTPKEYVGLDTFIGGGRNELEEIKFMLRIDRKTSIIKTENPRKIYNIFTELVERKYNVANSFRNVIYDLLEDLQNATISKITLGNPVKSMLGTRAANINESFEISGVPALADFKYDGLRVQIHNNNGEVKLFSRNLDEITKQFPEIIDFIKENYSELSFVIDSECVGFDFDKQIFLPFQTLSKRIMTKEFNEVKHINICVRAFDIMYLNGKTLIDEPYEKRRQRLSELFVGKRLVQNINFNLKDLKKVNNTWEY